MLRTLPIDSHDPPRRTKPLPKRPRMFWELRIIFGWDPTAVFPAHVVFTMTSQHNYCYEKTCKPLLERVVLCCVACIFEDLEGSIRGNVLCHMQVLPGTYFDYILH
jgi:hypothetical protein